jgi:hypothetical protein
MFGISPDKHSNRIVPNEVRDHSYEVCVTLVT